MDLREIILGKQDDLPIESVKVPEWKDPDGKVVTVWVKSLNSTERDEFEANSLKKVKGKREFDHSYFRARLVVLAAIRSPEDRVPLFQEADTVVLSAKSAKSIDRIYEVAARLAGIRDEDVEELVKNYGTGQSAGSGSS